VTELKPAILSVPEADLDSWFAGHGAPAYRRRQVMGWIARGAVSFDEMRDLPKPLRAELDTTYRVTSLRPVATVDADRRLTTKTLYELDGGHTV
jgi:23S rRNA (adenine2503-C2)-methyltransferase